MKYIEVNYSQLLGKEFSINALASICTKGTKDKDTLGIDGEVKMAKGFKKIGSKKLYGSSLLVEKLWNF